MLAKLPVERQSLLDAATYIEEHGWCQFYLQMRSGAVCMLGAMSRTVPRECGFDGAWIRSVHLVQERTGCVGISTWNDAPERTKEEVVSALRAAALHGL